MNNNLITILTDIAKELPTGLTDPKALEKLDREWDELWDELEDRGNISVEAVMEAGDVTYYSIKAFENKLFTDKDRNLNIQIASDLVGLSTDGLLYCAIAKMILRANTGNPKNHQKEKEVVVEYLEGRQ